MVWARRRWARVSSRSSAASSRRPPPGRAPACAGRSGRCPRPLPARGRGVGGAALRARRRRGPARRRRGAARALGRDRPRPDPHRGRRARPRRLGGRGFAPGILLPVPVAIPVGILLPFVWFAFVPAMEPVWLRHITGMFRDCCGLSEDVGTGRRPRVGPRGPRHPPRGGRCRRVLARRRSASPCPALALVVAAGPPPPRWLGRDDLRASLAARRLAARLPHVVRHHPVRLAGARPRGRRDPLDRRSPFEGRWAAAGIKAPPLVTEAGRSTTPPGSIPVLLNSSAPDDVIFALAEVPRLVPHAAPTASSALSAALPSSGSRPGMQRRAGCRTRGLREDFGSTWGSRRDDP